jgi:hypothetical protein
MMLRAKEEVQLVKNDMARYMSYVRHQHSCVSASLQGNTDPTSAYLLLQRLLGLQQDFRLASLTFSGIVVCEPLQEFNDGSLAVQESTLDHNVDHDDNNDCTISDLDSDLSDEEGPCENNCQ